MIGEMTSTTTDTRYMDTATCAAYIGRSVQAVKQLVFKKQIPVIKVGHRLSFDKERIDKWMDRHAQRGAMV